MQDDTPDHLYTVVAHSKYTDSCLSYNSKRFRKKIVQCLSFCKPLLEFFRLFFQFLIGELLHLRLQRINMIHDRVDSLQFMFAVRSKYLFNNSHFIKLLIFLSLIHIYVKVKRESKTLATITFQNLFNKYHGTPVPL